MKPCLMRLFWVKGTWLIMLSHKLRWPLAWLMAILVTLVFLTLIVALMPQQPEVVKPWVPIRLVSMPASEMPSHQTQNSVAAGMPPPLDLPKPHGPFAEFRNDSPSVVQPSAIQAPAALAAPRLQPLNPSNFNEHLQSLLHDWDLTVDTDYRPLVQVPPLYPQKALVRGIEGYVLLEFTVTHEGRVIDPKIMESRPVRVFDQAALKAIAAFRYQPKIIQGEAVAVTGVRHKIIFSLE